jgi:hypothetical protein
MRDPSQRRTIPRGEYEAIEADLTHAKALLKAALEDASDKMRGWSDLAEKASISTSIQPLVRRVADLERQLGAVTPDENATVERPIDEIIADAWANADVFRLEIWDRDHFVEAIPHPDGPADLAAIAEALRSAGRMGELRLLKGEPHAAEERIVAIYLLAPTADGASVPE